MERDSSRVNSSRWYDIQTKARSKELKERERTKRQTATAQKNRRKAKNNTKIIYSSPSKQAPFFHPVRLQTTTVSSARLLLQGPRVCMHAYISQMTITTINRREEQNPQQPPLIVRLTAKVTRVKMKYDASIKRRDSSPQILYIR